MSEVKSIEELLATPKSYAEVRSEIAHTEAKKLGLVVVVPKSNELFIDLDSEAQVGHFERCLPIFSKRFPCSTRRTPSPSGEPHHFHVVVTLLVDKVDDRTRVLYQACLGSDPVRELLSLQRIELKDEMPTIFFERPDDVSN